MSEKRMAIMRGVDFGLRDIGRPCLWFETYIDESSGALQVLTGEQITKLLEESGARSIRELEGKPCWVETDGVLGGRITFAGFCRMPGGRG